MRDKVRDEVEPQASKIQAPTHVGGDTDRSRGRQSALSKAMAPGGAEVAAFDRAGDAVRKAEVAQGDWL